jgi:hypothetical protein
MQMDLATVSTPDQAARAAYQAARQARIQAARVDVNAFVELAIRDESSGQAIVQAPMHEEWHRLSAEHPRVVIKAHVESGKSSQLTIARVLWELGRNPSLRVAIVSNTHGQAVKLLRAIATYIEQGAEVRAVFPKLTRGIPWNDSALAVARPVVSKDPSIQAFGVGGAVIGSRIDLLILDDVVDFENARTAEQRDKLVAWVQSALLGRLTANGRVIVVGTAFHPEDVLHRLEAQGWPTFRYGIEDEHGEPRWQQRWTRERIAAKRRELGPAEAARQLDVMARSDGDSRFKQAWIDGALDRGAGRHIVPQLLSVPAGGRVVHGVDLAVSKKASADLSVIFSLLVHRSKERQLLSIQSGRWSGPEIVKRILSAHRAFGGTFVVESVAAQAYVSQFLRELSTVPVIDFKTGRNKMSLEWQVETLAGELERGDWIVPSDAGRPTHPEVGAFLRDLLYYSPAAHTPDRLAAACFARWGAERGANRVEWGRLNLGPP